MELKGILQSDEKFKYQLLGRLQSDCEYYLGYGNRSKRNLWAQDEIDQIKLMKNIWESFPAEGKPEWLTWDDILAYENKMTQNILDEDEGMEMKKWDCPKCGKVKHISVIEDKIVVCDICGEEITNAEVGDSK